MATSEEARTTRIPASVGDPHSAGPLTTTIAEITGIRVVVRFQNSESSILHRARPYFCPRNHASPISALAQGRAARKLTFSRQSPKSTVPSLTSDTAIRNSLVSAAVVSSLLIVAVREALRRSAGRQGTFHPRLRPGGRVENTVNHSLLLPSPERQQRETPSAGARSGAGPSLPPLPRLPTAPHAQE